MIENFNEKSLNVYISENQLKTDLKRTVKWNKNNFTPKTG